MSKSLYGLEIPNDNNISFLNLVVSRGHPGAPVPHAHLLAEPSTRALHRMARLCNALTPHKAAGTHPHWLTQF